MGSDPAPIVSNLFLYFYENELVGKMKKVDLNRARRLANVFRFIDNLQLLIMVVNLSVVLKKYILLSFNSRQTIQETLKNHFWTFFINIESNWYSVNLFDKRDVFPFSIVRIPHLSNNIPLNVFYAAYRAEILRIARVANTKTNFINHCSLIVSRMINQVGSVNTISKTVSKTFGRYFEMFSKFFPVSLEFGESFCT